MKTQKLQLFSFLLLIVFFLAFSNQIYSQGTNIITNGDQETATPFFWNAFNEGDGGAVCTWADDEAYALYRSFKVEKPNASSAAAGWISGNQADAWWNRMGTSENYSGSFSVWMKTMGVNTSPASDDAKIGVRYKLYSGGTLQIEEFLAADQSAADMDWHEVTVPYIVPTGLFVDSLIVTCEIGKDATGTVWFDNVGMSTDPWAGGIFGSQAESAKNFEFWTAGADAGHAVFTDEAAHSGSYSSVLIENDDNDDEQVYWSFPVAAKPNTYYKVSVWVKVDTINTDEKFLPTNVTPDRDNARAGITFFYHREGFPLDKSWELTGGDQFFYIDQRTGSSDEWVKYSVISKSPEDAAGVSIRSRFTSFPKGKVYYDDFSIEELELGENLITNGDQETATPFFWNAFNEGDGGAVCTWANDEAYALYRSFKVEKPNASSAAAGWVSGNHADAWWNRMGTSENYSGSFSVWMKTMGVNTSPASDDAKIGVRYKLYSGGTLQIEEFLAADQSAADMDWHEVTVPYIVPTGLFVDSLIVTCEIGKDATGTVWFDNVGMSTDPWAGGIFGSQAESAKNFEFWTAGADAGHAVFTDEAAHSGSYSSVLIENDDNDDEQVYWSFPVAAKPNTYYLISGWVKADTINTDDRFLASNITPDRDNDRAGFTFFYHREGFPLDKSWELTGGDQFFYIDQRTGSSDEWVKYSVISKSPEDAAGISVRSRFTSFPKGKVYYDDFSVQEITNLVTGVDNIVQIYTATLPKHISLEQNYPNPFNPETKITYTTPVDDIVTLEVYNLLGQKIKTLYSGFMPAGHHSARFDGRDKAGNQLPSGVYIYQLRTSNNTVSNKMLLLK